MNKALEPLGMGLMSGLILAAALSAQRNQPDQEELVNRRDAKLAAKFLQNGDWVTNYDEALAAAKKSKKLVFAYFTRSFSP